MTWVPPQLFQSDWNRLYVPSRGLAYSFVLHELVLLACFSFSAIASPPIVLRTPEQEIRSAEITYLPNTGGGDSGGKSGERGKEGEGKSTSGPKREGITFKGPQYIRSDYPNPDNNLQTILQPALSNTPRLNFPLQVPNIIRVARPKPENITPPKIKVDASLKDVPLPTPRAKPVLKAEAEPIATPLHSDTVPLLALPQMQPITKNEPDKIVVTPEEKTPPPPVVAADATVADQSLAVLNAMQIKTPSLVIPPGEKRASFEVSPAGTATTHVTASRAGLPGGKPGAGSGTGVGTARAGAGEGGSGSGHSGNGEGKTGTVTVSSTSGPGGGRGNGASGSGTGAKGNGGTGTVRGPGSGNGNGSGPGTGSGSGSGEGPFPGIQVIGGAGSGLQGNNGGGGAHAPSGTGRSYDFTIIASGGSGGGLKDFGVFRNEAVYTVYVDVSDIAPTSQAWILQYADSGSGPRTAEVNLGSDGSLQAPSTMLEPPYALTKLLPEKLSSPPTNAMTVITGIISRDGKMENARVLQAPTEEIGKQWAEAIAKWSFRPASKGGSPIPVRALLGIPVF
jgi:hypothetical protein